MAKFSRFIDLAAKALEKASSPQTQSPSPAASAGADWRSTLRNVTDAATGDLRGAQGRPYQPSPPAPGAAPVGLTPPVGRYAPAAPAPVAPADRAAIARYEYLLQTADPHQVEQIHREAFARLTPEQRIQVQARMQAELRPAEQPRSAQPVDLARTAARSEAMQPGIMAGLLARAGAMGGARAGGARTGTMGRNAALLGAGGLLGAVAGGAVMTAVAAPLLAQAAGWGVDFEAMAGAVDVEALAGDALGGLGDQLSGAGDMVSGIGDQFSNFEVLGLGDLF